VARDAALEEYRLFNGPFGVDRYDSHASDLLEPLLSQLTLRRPTSADILRPSCGSASFASGAKHDRRTARAESTTSGGSASGASATCGPGSGHPERLRGGSGSRSQ
jgi:hypothetical protein